MGFWGPTLALALGLGGFGPGPARGASDTSTLVKLEGDFLNLAEVRLGGPGAPAQLLVMEADRGVPRRQRWIEVFDKRDGKLTKSPNATLPADAAAFDVCQLAAEEGASETLLLIRKQGIYPLGAAKPLAATPTLFAHARDDLLPRVRVCFDLFAGPGGKSAKGGREGPALVVPTLQGVAIFRQARPGVFARHAEIDVQAEIGFHGQVLRGEDRDTMQRISTRLQFPDVTASDMDGDGLVDLCFSAEEALTCHLQDAAKGFAGTDKKGRREYFFEVRSPSERLDTSSRVTSRLVDLSGDGRPDFVVSKSTWNISAMGGSVHVYVQAADGTFPKAPTQVLTRQGYFAYQEYLDYDGDGWRDIVAPVASLGWTDLARIYFSRSADIEFVWYRNVAGKVEAKARPIHKLAFPVEFRNIAAILGSLPVWHARLRGQGDGGKGREVLFFPKKAALELRLATAAGVGPALWEMPAKLGSETVVVDLDGDGRHEVVSASPKDQERSGALLFIDTPVLGPASE